MEKLLVEISVHKRLESNTGGLFVPCRCQGSPGEGATGEGVMVCSCASYFYFVRSQLSLTTNVTPKTPNEIRLLAYPLLLLQIRTAYNLQRVRPVNIKQSSESQANAGRKTLLPFTP